MHESIRHLRLDRRLISRRSWISPEELEAELARLPDVASKAAKEDEAEISPREEAAPAD